jgi:ribosomal protein S18 acetylase RimI-like enzyme
MLRWLRLADDVTVTTIGRAVCIRTPRLAGVDFLNSVHRLLPDEAGLVPEVVAHYAGAGCVPWLELMPAPGFEALADALHAAGARQYGFWTVQHRPLPAPEPAPLPDGVAIERVGADLDDFARVLPVGHGVPAENLDGAVARTRHQSEIDGTSLYLATVDGTPAAAAVLFQQGDLAYLASASTLPQFRRRGCQTALVQRRLADAVAAGCRRACVLTEWMSQSHANMARAGFTTAYTKAMWRIDRPS